MLLCIVAGPTLNPLVSLVHSLRGASLGCGLLAIGGRNKCSRPLYNSLDSITDCRSLNLVEEANSRRPPPWEVLRQLTRRKMLPANTCAARRCSWWGTPCFWLRLAKFMTENLSSPNSRLDTARAIPSQLVFQHFVRVQLDASLIDVL